MEGRVTIGTVWGIPGDGPRASARVAHPSRELLVALEETDDANVAQLPVVAGDRLLGMIDRERILHHVRGRAELGT